MVDWESIEGDATAALRAGDYGRFAQIVRTWIEGRVGRAARAKKLSDADAADVAQNVLVTLLRKGNVVRAAVVDRGYPLQGYLAGVIRNRIHDYFRELSDGGVQQASPDEDAEWPEPAIEGPAPDERVADTEESRGFVASIDRLPRTRDRAVLKLRLLIEGGRVELSPDEAAWCPWPDAEEAHTAGDVVKETEKHRQFDAEFCPTIEWVVEILGRPDRRNNFDQWYCRAKQELCSLISGEKA